MRYFATFGAFYSPGLSGILSSTSVVVTSTSSSSEEPLSPSGLATAPGSTSSSLRGTRPRSTSMGGSTVWPEDQEVQFRSQNSNVSNLVMPDEALLIAGNSICPSTRSKYKSMFNRFIMYGRTMGTNVLLYSFSQVLVIGFLAAIAALYVTMSVGRSVGLLVRRSVSNEFQCCRYYT